MLVLLSCGPSSNQIIRSISSELDNIDCLCYLSVVEFINQSKLRHLAFDRLVFTSKFISSDKDMSTLCDYVRSELSSVEVVMVLSSSQGNMEDVFKKYFDSPMHTVIYVDKPTIKSMADAVKMSIADLKARYYSLEKGQEGTADNKNAKLGLFKGGKKNKTKKSEKKDSSKEPVKSSESVPENEVNNVEDLSKGSTSEDTSNNISLNENSNDVSIDGNVNFESSVDSSSSYEDLNDLTGNSAFSGGEFDLSIGDFGSQHSDSGFVGDDDIDELQEFANSQNNIQNSTVQEVKSTSNERKPVVKDTPVEPAKSVIKEESVIEEPQRVASRTPEGIKRGINIITGLNGSGATAYVINESARLRKAGNRVLIVNLDYIHNGLLSFIDINRFCDSGCVNGLNKLKMYTEDGIDILSNMYGCPLSVDVKELFNNPIVRRYDYILVDAPINCLRVIPDDTFCLFNVIVCCITDISKLIDTSFELYNRDMVSLRKEIHISQNGVSVNKNIKSGDITRLKEFMLFPNGCWCG